MILTRKLTALLFIFIILISPVNVFCEEGAGEPLSESQAIMAEDENTIKLVDPEEYEEGYDEDEKLTDEYTEPDELTVDEEAFDEGQSEYMVEATGEGSSQLEEIEYSRAKVLKIISEEEREINYSGSGLTSCVQIVEALVIKGMHKDDRVIAECELNFGFGDKYKAVSLKPGDEVFLLFEENEDGSIAKAYVVEVARDKYLLYLAVGFLLLLIVVGRLKGLKAIISLTLTVLGVWKVLLPAILKGWDPVLVSVALCVAVICVTMVIISGFNRKTGSAIIGTVGGVLIAGILALVVGTLAKLTGFGDDESQMLLYIPQNIRFDFRGLLFSGIIIGTMGATMDVGMSIASAMHEIKVNSPKIGTMELIRAGMNVGRDAMATMANTLILAYAGGSLHLMLLLMAYNTSFTDIINWDLIASEVLRAIAGSIGIVFAIPFTALAAGLIEEYKKREKNAAGVVDYRL